MKKNGIIFFTALLCSAAAFAGGSQEVETQIDADGFKSVSANEIEVRWKAEGENMTFELTAPTTGWVSIGFNPSRLMKDADFIFGYVEGSEVVVADHFGNGTFSHTADTELGGSEDIIEYSGREGDGNTTLTFTIPMDSGDQYDTVLTPGEEHTVLIAYGADGADNFTEKHRDKVKVKIKL